jgi:16S rRNA (cytosine967-C5)-methyltransferase
MESTHSPARPSSRRPKKPSRVRGLALDVLNAWAGGERYASDLLELALRDADLITPDAAMVREIVLRTLRSLTLLDHWIDHLTGSKHLDHRTRWAVRVGLCQVLIMGVSEHAAVHETVAAAGRARGFVNAVLRRACREKEELLAAVDALPAETRLSHPKWLVERWRTQLGEQAALDLSSWNQQNAPLSARINRLHPEMAQSTEDMRECETLPREDLAEGRLYMQDASTLLAPRLLDPKPGQRVLDACAAPGGKTAFMAQLMRNEGEILACDISAARLRRLQSNLKRLHITNTQILQHDWATAELPADVPSGFDAILLDVPCSNTGVMRRRVDVRWRLQPESFAELHALQESLLIHGLGALRPGGVLVYSTCSIDAEENGLLVRRVLSSLPGYQLAEEVSSLPPASGMDGAYAAKIIRAD